MASFWNREAKRLLRGPNRIFLQYVFILGFKVLML